MKNDFKRPIFFSIIFVALGIIFINVVSASLGIVFVALSGLFFIIGMKKKMKLNKK